MHCVAMLQEVAMREATPVSRGWEKRHLPLPCKAKRARLMLVNNAGKVCLHLFLLYQRGRMAWLALVTSCGRKMWHLLICNLTGACVILVTWGKGKMLRRPRQKSAMDVALKRGGFICPPVLQVITVARAISAGYCFTGCARERGGDVAKDLDEVFDEPVNTTTLGRTPSCRRHDDFRSVKEHRLDVTHSLHLWDLPTPWSQDEP